MAGSSEAPDPDSGSDLISTIGLLLNLGGIIWFAVWLSMIGGAYRDGSAAIAGVATLVCFGGSFGCFAADRPTGSAPIASGPIASGPIGGGPISSGRYPTGR